MHWLVPRHDQSTDLRLTVWIEINTFAAPDGENQPSKRVRLTRVFCSYQSKNLERSLFFLPLGQLESSSSVEISPLVVNNSTVASDLEDQRNTTTYRGIRAKLLGNLDFLGSKRKFWQSQFLKTFPCFFYYLKT